MNRFGQQIVVIVWLATLAMIVGMFWWLATGRSWWVIDPTLSDHSKEGVGVLLCLLHVGGIGGFIATSCMLGSKEE